MDSPPSIKFPKGATIHSTLGALYIGNMVVAMLFGVTSLQMYTYFTRNPKDSIVLRFFIFVLWILDVLHVVCIGHEFYFYTVVNYGNVAILLNITWSVVMQLIVMIITDSIIRGIFAHRLWHLSGKNKPLLTSIVVASSLVFGGGLVFGVLGAREVSYVSLDKLSWIMYTCLAAVALADVIICAALCILLRRQGAGFKRSKSIIRTLMLYSINTTALTSICAIVCVICYAAMPNNFIYQVFLFSLSKLYLNSLLATLNARKTLREAYSGEPVSIALRRAGDQDRTTRAWRTAVDPETGDEVLDIQIETTTHTKYDDVDNRPVSREGTKEETHISLTGPWDVKREPDSERSLSTVS